MPRRLLVMDVDSTLISAEQIDLLAARAGSGDQVAAITALAMAGELDFVGSLRRRVATLAGLPATALDEVRREVALTPGARELLAHCAEHEWPVGLVSGGFHEIIDPLVAGLGVARVQANRLQMRDGVLTGEVDGPVVDAATKETFLRTFAADCGVAMADTIAIGDGANDLDMVTAAGLGVAFEAKPVLAAAADLALPGPRLDDLLAHLSAATPHTNGGSSSANPSCRR